MYTAELPSGQFPLSVSKMVAADLLIYESSTSFAEVREAVRNLTGGEAAGVCNINVKVMKPAGEATTFVIYFDWKRVLVVPV